MDKTKTGITTNSAQQLEFEFNTSLPQNEEKSVKKKPVIINLQDATKQLIIDQILRSTKCF